MSQKTEILEYMIAGKHITQAEAAVWFRCYRLSERIREIEKLGYFVSRKKVKNVHNTGYHTEYWLEAK